MSRRGESLLQVHVRTGAGLVAIRAGAARSLRHVRTSSLPLRPRPEAPERVLCVRMRFLSRLHAPRQWLLGQRDPSSLNGCAQSRQRRLRNVFAILRETHGGCADARSPREFLLGPSELKARGPDPVAPQAALL